MIFHGGINAESDAPQLVVGAEDIEYLVGSSRMLRQIAIVLLVLGLTACVSAPATTPIATVPQPPPVTPSQPVPLASEWAGAITHADGTRESITAKFDETGGTLNIEPFIKTYPIEKLQRTASTLSFNVSMTNELHLSGTFGSTQLSGQIEGPGPAGTFTLLPLFPETRDALNDFLGTYQFEPGRALLIHLAPDYSSSGRYFFGQGLMVTRFDTGAVRALYPIAKDTFLVGSARAIGYPFAAQITFMRDSNGHVTGLSWQARDPQTGDLGHIEPATRLALQSKVVHFMSKDGTNLTGLLTLPATAGPYPAIMLLHGSEPGTKDNFGSQQMSAFMASQGIVTLSYDKRGVGDSSGVYSESASETNLNLTAQDALAGVEYLKGLPEIQADKIGLTGFSQAGWVIPLAASQSNAVAYFIILSGPVTSVGHENLYSSYSNDGESTTSLSQQDLMNKLASAPHSGFDSTPVIAQLDQLGLWIFGDHDRSIPVPESVDHLKAIIAQGKSNFAYLTLTGADHNLQQTTQGLFNEIPYSSGYHADYYKTMVRWLEEHVSKP